MTRKPFADIKCLFRCKLKLQGACDSSGTYCAPAKTQRRGGLPVWWVPFESHLKNSPVNEFGCIIPGLLEEDSNSHCSQHVLPLSHFLSPLSKLVLTQDVVGGGWTAGEARSQGDGGLCSPTLLFQKERVALIQFLGIQNYAEESNDNSITCFQKPFHFFFFPIS